MATCKQCVSKVASTVGVKSFRTFPVISLYLLKYESLDNAIYSRALIGSAIMVYEPLYHALQIL